MACTHEPWSVSIPTTTSAGSRSAPPWRATSSWVSQSLPLPRAGSRRPASGRSRPGPRHRGGPRPSHHRSAATDPPGSRTSPNSGAACGRRGTRSNGSSVHAPWDGHAIPSAVWPPGRPAGARSQTRVLTCWRLRNRAFPDSVTPIRQRMISRFDMPCLVRRSRRGRRSGTEEPPLQLDVRDALAMFVDLVLRGVGVLPHDGRPECVLCDFTILEVGQGFDEVAWRGERVGRLVGVAGGVGQFGLGGEAVVDGGEGGGEREVRVWRRLRAGAPPGVCLCRGR